MSEAGLASPVSVSEAGGGPVLHPGQQADWRAGRPVALDHGGPVDRPYDREAAALLLEDGGLAAILRMAARWPERTVVDDGVVRLTYAQLLDRAWGLAERIVGATADGAAVVSLTPPSAAAPVIILASALAGRIHAPIDATHPRERQAAILAESGAQAAIVAAGVGMDDGFLPPELPRLLVDPAQPTGAAPFAPRYRSGQPLFVAFSSGSTGRPKGVASAARGSELRQFVDMFHVNADDVILALASPSQGGARDAFVALASGARVRLLDARPAGLGELLRVMGEEGVTILSFVPTALRMILSIPGADAAFRHLRALDLHGERILASDIALFREKLPQGCAISITFGAMESGAVFSWFVDDARIDGPVAPVGYPLPGRSVALLGDDGRAVADGEPGELFVRGPMALGAWRGGALAQGPFLPDPDDAAGRIYPMGDVMRRRADGLYEYVERKDRRVKVRGQWADLGEIEAALRGIDGVADACVISVGSGAEGERLTAFLVMVAAAPAPSPGAVRAVVARETAEHMAPAQVRVLEAIPRLANYKPDLVRLKALAGA